MLSIEDCRVVFVAVGLVGILVFASPTVMLLVQPMKGEAFSEVWLLGSGMMAQDYPFDVKSDVTYSVNVGVGNHMGSSVCYYLYVKLRNESDFPPNATAGTPSSVLPLYVRRVFVQDGKNWSGPLDFMFSGISFSKNQSVVHGVTLNGVAFDVDKSALWDSENNGCYYQLFVELWIYNVTSDHVEFHDRFVGLWLNMTA